MAVKIDITKADPLDAALLEADARQADIDEVLAGAGCTIGEAAAFGVASGEAYTLWFDGKVAAMWGVREMEARILGGSLGEGWLLTTNQVNKFPIAFWKICLLVLPALLEKWGCLTNAIDCRHEMALRWGKRLGFQLDAPANLRGGIHPFQKFTVTKGDMRWALQGS